MNRYLLIFTPILFMGIGNIAFSQSKAEEKEWAKKLDQLDPMDYKALVERKDTLNKHLSDCESREIKYRNELEAKDLEIEKLKKELQDYSSGAVPGVAPKSEATEAPKQQVKQAKEVNGLVYKVQIGSFKNKDLTKYFDNNPNFSGEVDADGVKKYTLGVFTDYWEAENLKKALREMGVKGAWIVAYKDGQRVNMKDAREGVL